MNSNQKYKKGFTLIELLVVIAVIGILASVTVASLNSARSKSRDAKRRLDMKNISTALMLYYAKYGSYPVTSTPACGVDIYSFCSAATSTNWIPGLTEFISPIPSSPSTSPSWGDYMYGFNNGGKTFLLTTVYENNSPNTCTSGGKFFVPNSDGVSASNQTLCTDWGWSGNITAKSNIQP